MREEEIKQLEIDKIHWRDLYWEECEKNKRLKEENETLKDNVEFLHSCLDDRDKSIEIMKEENKSDWLNRKITFMEFIYTAIVYGLFWLLVVVFIEAIF